MSKPTNITQILLELDTLLDAERQALKDLAANDVEDIAARKVQLVAQLAQLIPGANPSAEEAAALKRIREKQLRNQLLLVHARDSVRGLITALTGSRPASYSRIPSTNPPVREGSRLHVSV